MSIMKSNNTVFIGLLFLLFQQSPAQNQQQRGELLLGTPVSAKISSGETHRYKIWMEKHQFALFKLFREDLDVHVTARGPEGEKLTTFEISRGHDGPRYFSILSKNSGNYTLDISPSGTSSGSGEYSMELGQLQSKAETKQGQVDELFAPYTLEETPGTAVAVVRNGAIEYQKGFGMANLEYGIEVTPQTVFHVASLSKQFTVFSVLLLEREGELSLDDDIRKYIPEVPDFGKTITLRHLASHTSGLRDQWDLLSMAGWRMDDVITTEHILKMVSRQEKLNFEPGEEFIYCNTGFTLLAEVVARVSGVSFADFTRTRIFEPLQMNNTLFYDDHEKIVENRAYSYYPEGTGFKKSPLNFANVGATSLFTTVEDLSLWTLNFADAKVGNPEIFKIMNTPAVLNDGRTFGGALGQFVGQYKGVDEIQHGGADAGFRSFLTRFPKESLSVIVLSNEASFSADRMAHEVAEIYLGNAVQNTEPRIADVEVDLQAAGDTIQVAPDVLNAYIGEFELDLNYTVKVFMDNGQLFVKPPGEQIFLLKPLSQVEFSVEGAPSTMEFVADTHGKFNVMKLKQGTHITENVRVEPFDKDSVDLSSFTGRFYSEELATEYEFVEYENRLIAKHHRLSDIVLTPVREDLFYGNIWFFNQIEFVRDTNQNISGCRISSGRVKNLDFKKRL